MLSTLRLWVGLRISGDTNLEIRHPLEPGDKISGVGVPAGLRFIAWRSTWRVAAQCHDVVDPGLPIIGRDRIDFSSGSSDAGQVSGGLERGLAADAADRRMGAFAGRPARTVGHRD